MQECLREHRFSKDDQIVPKCCAIGILKKMSSGALSQQRHDNKIPIVGTSVSRGHLNRIRPNEYHLFFYRRTYAILLYPIARKFRFDNVILKSSGFNQKQI